MEEYYGLGNRNRGKATENEEFQEEEVWAAIKERETSSSKVMMMRKSSSSSSAWRLPVAPRVIPRTTSHDQSRVEQSSAPVSIPDWSKIYWKSNSMKGDEGDGNVVLGCGDHTEEGDDQDDDDDDNEMVPPHEYIARRLARTQIASFSMCEGVGRTLKGRELSKLRNAILTKTGFLEG